MGVKFGTVSMATYYFGNVNETSPELHLVLVYRVFGLDTRMLIRQLGNQMGLVLFPWQHVHFNFGSMVILS